MSDDASSSRFRQAKARASAREAVPPPPPPPPPSLKPAVGAEPGARPPALSNSSSATDSDLLKLEDLHRYANLLVFAQAVVEGYYSGRHRSAEFGSNAEFAEYKGYVEGDPIADIDWRVFARSRDLFIRKYNEETDMVVYLVVDVSGSMNYRGSGLENKITRAARIAAALSYLMIRQGDKVSLTMVNDRIRRFVPAAGTRRHLHEVVSTLEQFTGSSHGETRLADGLQECVPLFGKRGRIVLISDFFDDSESLFDALGTFIHRGFDVLLMQVLDRHEIDLPDVHIARFIDAETGEEVQVEPGDIRSAYRESMEKFQSGLQTSAVEHRMRYAPLGTDKPYLDAIESYLGFRENSR